jgi:uncharacterized RDD family membrane protein YckC
MTTNIRDPRSIVTPDAFDVSKEMLGLPLAPPGRRAFAMFVDLIVIGLITAFVSGWGFVVWGVIGLAMLQLAFRTPSGSWTRGQLGKVTAWGYRGSVGCLGLFILLMVVVISLGSRAEFSEDDLERAVESLAENSGVAEALREAGATAQIRGTGDLESLSVILGEGAGQPADSALIREAATLDPAELAATLTDLDQTDAPDSVAVGGTAVPTEAWLVALRARAVELFASDTVATLEGTAAQQAGRIASLRAELDAAEAEADSGLFALMRDVFGQLGSAFGVWTLYFTVATVVLRGRTVGKLAARIRVVRLDGEPLTWLPSLERAGGYAAGVATGLMGFMRVFWDRNRQCVHDRIVGTVVVLDGASAIPGSWEEVWTEEGEEAEA